MKGCVLPYMARTARGTRSIHQVIGVVASSQRTTSGEPYRGAVARRMKGRSLPTTETPTLERTPSVNGAYFKNSLAALLALSVNEPPPLFLALVLLCDLPLNPFFEVSPDFSRYFLPSLRILSIMRPDHVPSSDVVCYLGFYPIETI
jgi:hypothetical protein